MTTSRSNARKKQALKHMEEKGHDVRRLNNPSEEDRAAIQQQLGFLPTNVHSIAARGQAGEPVVLKLYPLAVSLKGARAGNLDRQPFPTTYWLSSPSLKAAVSQLENKGFVNKWERQIQADPDLILEMQAAHRCYAGDRWAMLTESDVALIKQRGWESSLGLKSGAAGISTEKPGTIKCLHAHLAHFLATGQNVVGRWVQLALDGGEHTLCPIANMPN